MNIAGGDGPNHVVFEASAGTGKTYALTKRIIDEYGAACNRRDDVPWSSFLVITFTEKAARDLRYRLRRELLALTKMGGQPDKIRLDCSTYRSLSWEMLSGFHRLHISTIHAFCRQVLFRYAFGVGLPRQGNKEQDNELTGRIIRKILRNIANAPESGLFRLLAHIAGMGRVKQVLERAEKLMDVGLPVVPNCTPESLDMAAASVIQLLRNENITELLMDVRKSTRSRSHFLEEFKLMAEIAKVGWLDGIDAICDPNTRALDRVSEWLQKKLTDSPGSQLAAFAAHLFPLVYYSHHPEVVLAASLQGVARKMLWAERIRSGALMFSDQISYLADILSSPAGDEIRYSLREQYRRVFIDECQDTDPLQWEIIRNLFFQDRGTRAVLAGDPKQAIYGFRNADVHNYMYTIRDLLDHGAICHVLDTNYRSGRGCVEFINACFSTEKGVHFFGNPLNSSVNVRSAHPDIGLQSSAGALLPGVVIGAFDRASEGSADDYRRAFIAWIVEQVEKLFPARTGESVYYRDKSGARRVLRLNDIMVVAQRNADAEHIRSALALAGFPATLFRSPGLFGEPEARELLALLRALCEPDASRFAKEAALSGLITGQRASLRPSLRVDAPAVILKTLDNLRRACDEHGVADSIRRHLEENGWFFRCILNGEQDGAMLHMRGILDLIEMAWAGEVPSIDACADWLEKQIRESEAGASRGDFHPLPDDDDMIQVLTIHGSKGLEAPVVFVFAGFGNDKMESPVQFFLDGKRRIFWGFSGAPRDPHIANAIENERNEEYKRLIYVAFTRAAAALYVPAFAGKNGGSHARYAIINERIKQVMQVMDRFEGRISVVPVAVNGTPAPKSVQEGGGQTGRDFRGQFELPEQIVQPCDCDARTVAELQTLGRRPLEASFSAVSRRREQKAGLDGAEALDAMESRAVTEGVKLSHAGASSGGGLLFGSFVHGLIERITTDEMLRTELSGLPVEKWPVVLERDLWMAAQRVAFAVGQDDYAAGVELAYRALMLPVSISGRCSLAPIMESLRSVSEMRFQFPLSDGQLVWGAPGRTWGPNTTLWVGAADIVFEQAGRVYLADWKTNWLLDYSAEAVLRHVQENYLLQEKIYTVALVRALQIQSAGDYERLFGGVLFVYLRGLAADTQGEHGIYFRRVEWNEILKFALDLDHAAACLRR